jgi:hypothetical protein
MRIYYLPGYIIYSKKREAITHKAQTSLISVRKKEISNWGVS